MLKGLAIGCLALTLCAFTPLPQWECFKSQTLCHQDTIHGWCSREKAEKLMDLIYDIQPTVCVEIGVFGGSSIYPTAQALSFQGQGQVYAIDPWSNEACVMGYQPDDPNYKWWQNVDLNWIYSEFKKMLETHQLSSYCHILRMTSKEALSHFEDESIDILHIDGNHSEESALLDAQFYLPKVKINGYIWFDDADWSSTTQAIIYLLKQCILVEDRSVGTHCLLFQKLPQKL